MDSFNEAEISELVRLYIQSKLKKILPKLNFGLYGGDGLVILINFNGQQTEKVRKTSSEYLKILTLALRLKLISKKQIF